MTAPGPTADEAQWRSFLGTLRGTRFTHAEIRTSAVLLEVHRGRPVAVSGPSTTSHPDKHPAAPAEAGGPSRPPARGDVRAAAPGSVSVSCRSGQEVQPGDVLAEIQVHRRSVPVVATERGRVDAILVQQGEFVEYDQALLAVADGAVHDAGATDWVDS